MIHDAVGAYAQFIGKIIIAVLVLIIVVAGIGGYLIGKFS
jgi:hypothetical protein